MSATMANKTLNPINIPADQASSATRSEEKPEQQQSVARNHYKYESSMNKEHVEIERQPNEKERYRRLIEMRTALLKPHGNRNIEPPPMPEEQDTSLEPLPPPEIPYFKLRLVLGLIVICIMGLIFCFAAPRKTQTTTTLVYIGPPTSSAEDYGSLSGEP